MPYCCFFYTIFTHGLQVGRRFYRFTGLQVYIESLRVYFKIGGDMQTRQDKTVLVKDTRDFSQQTSVPRVNVAYECTLIWTIFEEEKNCFGPLWCNSALAVCLFWTLGLNKHLIMKTNFATQFVQGNHIYRYIYCILSSCVH